MLFNSLEFAIFLPIVFFLHYVLPKRFRWVLMLIASYVFYMAWQPAYGLLIFASTVVDYFVAIAIHGAPDQRRKKAFLMISLLVNLGILFSFKYYNLINGTFNWAALQLGVDWPMPESSLLLPVGISFYSFQTIGYSVDVYRGHVEPERHFGRFALYVSYFPQLVAGPIERARRLLPQLHHHSDFDWDRVVSGMRLAAWGLFKKVVVADRLSAVVDVVYGDVYEFRGFAYLIAAFFFAYQVYCDFSGYSDMAIGIARMFGVDLMTNFNQPHLSKSMAEIWSRWHISLSSWFQDYLYIPLGGNRVRLSRWAFNIAVVFIVSGLWHGATWVFALWGALHAFLIIGGRLTGPTRERIAKATGLAAAPRLHITYQIVTTYLLWVFTLIFFRAEDLPQALHIITHFHVGWSHLGDWTALANFLQRIHLDGVLFAYCVLLMPFTELVDYARRDERIWGRVEALPTPVRWSMDYAMIFAILALGRFTDVPFVYFQF